MKKIVFIALIAVLTISISSCKNKTKKANESAGTHTHEDGTTHQGITHSQNENATPDQESFEVKTDNDTTHHHEDVNSQDHDHEEQHQ
ncbi:hypothetical protein OU798_24695 [Prolixibacteraceae bacterium Z1-6]|uniref:Lipoprotein n=1 Tax=Draconibacterium aestuarii TaxID=2998507 RepID=A0A9X3FAK9_9BACT|nr:hypothetical protein [Prolixibacteraceae bacterium Z1-6]